ncbi:MAG: DUF21 domain-containing protein, partial [Spirochaetia bacterium]|nr:DUF21 domain-containing protein [Spirochaetia bacterium]
MLTPILLIIFFILISGILEAAEVALVVISDKEVALDAENGNKRAIKVLKFNLESKAYMTTIQVVITLLALINGAIALDVFKDDVIKWINLDHPIV